MKSMDCVSAPLNQLKFPLQVAPPNNVCWLMLQVQNHVTESITEMVRAVFDGIVYLRAIGVEMVHGHRFDELEA